LLDEISVEAGAASVCAMLVAVVVADIRERTQRLVLEANRTAAHVVGSNVCHGLRRKVVLGCLSYGSTCFSVCKEHVLEFFSIHEMITIKEC
jgi:hypothetical protein